MFKKIALAAAALTMIAAPATAADVASTVVRTADLDLTNAKDQARLEMRIKSAVNTVCNVRGHGFLRQTASVSRCKAEATLKSREAFQKLTTAAK